MALLLISLLIPLILGFIPPSSAGNTLGLGQHLSPSSPPLTSPSGHFSLSLRPFSASNSSSLYLVISFATADNFSVWIANRDKPASASSASLQFSSSGSLVLSDTSGILWSVPNPDAVTAQLLDSGNFVLFNESSEVVWQSFDNPAYSILPGQRFSVRQYLTAQSRSDSFASGSRTFQFSDNGVPLLSDSPDAGSSYWTWGTDVADMSAAQLSYLEYDVYGNLSLYHSGVVNSSCLASDHGSQPARRLTLDLDGNLRMYSWQAASARWIRVWLAVENVCTQVKFVCGNYGICILDPEPKCICPPGFQAKDQADIAQGCSAITPLECRSTNYVELESTDFPYQDYHEFKGTTESNCKTECSSSCTCLAAVFWQSSTDSGHCWLKSGLLNGFSLSSQKCRSFLKVSGFNQSAVTVVPDNLTHWNSDTIWRAAATPAGTANNTTFGRVHDRSQFLFVIMGGVIAGQLLVFSAIIPWFIRRSARRLRCAKLHRTSRDFEDLQSSFPTRNLMMQQAI